MSEQYKRAWQFYLDDMLEFSSKVISYTTGQDQAQFVDNEMAYDATLRNLELIGEAATHIPADVRDTYPEIPWRMIIATRNQLIHGYLGIDDDTVWSIVSDDVPALHALILDLKKQLQSD